MSFGARLRALAASDGGRPALTVVSSDGSETTTTYAELNALSRGVAALLKSHGVGPTSTVTPALGNTVAQFATCFGAWKLGACVVPLNPGSPPPERDQLLRLLAPDAVVADWDDLVAISGQDIVAAYDLQAPEPPDIAPRPGKGIASGGTTGLPKVIIDPGPWAKVPGSSLGAVGDAVAFHQAHVQLVPGPVHANMGFLWSVSGLFEGQHVIVLERFDPHLVLSSIERHRVEFVALVPSMMRRLSTVGSDVGRSLSTLTSLVHSAAHCTPALKRTWIDLVGPEVLYEVFGASENVGATVARGDKWLERPGTVGRPCGSEVRILDAVGHQVGPGTVGEIFMRPVGRPNPTYRYLGADPAKADADGFVSVEDLGWLDHDGYLYPADRSPDRIVTGGADVYPAEVEAVLIEHPQVVDAAVVGLPDDLWGEKVHAILVVDGAIPPTHEDLDRWCRQRISAYKVPKAFELVPRLPFDDTGRVRRQVLSEGRRS